MSDHYSGHTWVPAVQPHHQPTRRPVKFHHPFPRELPPSLSYPHMPPPQKLNHNIFISTFQFSDDLEKAVVRSTNSYDYPRSSASTLVSNTSYVDLQKPYPQQEYELLPPKRYPWVIRNLRYTLLTVYRRFFTLVIFLNIIPLVHVLHTQTNKLDTLATCASTNLFIAILIRQDYIINTIFRTAWLTPWRLPLRVRRWIARCYCYGGIHSGAAVAGTLWWIAFSTIMMIQFLREGLHTAPIVAITLAIMGLLVVIVVLAMPGARKRWHNAFELTHRLLGWTSVALFWVQLVLLTQHTSNIPTPATAIQRSFTIQLLKTPTFYTLSLITAMLIYPWLSIRSWTFTPEVLSSHAIRLRFNKKLHEMSFLSISTSPWREWHPFAVFPDRMATQGKTDARGGDVRFDNSMIVSDAGDWTHALIQRAKALQQKHDDSQHVQHSLTLYTRTHPRAGVLSLTTLFPRVLIVTTGSGIGPSLSSLLHRPPSQSIRLIWSTRSPLNTYGVALLDLVHQADPEAIIIDTDAVGRPDLVAVAWREVQRMGAEAVFVLGNEAVTRRVVGGLEGRGCPAFGPVWDS
jgi:hypothetical protein